MMKKAIMVVIVFVLIALITACYVRVLDSRQPPYRKRSTEITGVIIPQESIIMMSPDGKKWLLTIDDDGEIHTEPFASP